eukprot:CAMPEP_0196242822 /NCGR_PEP_ID=MMETSP0913-20130531/26081_1 /TAXON_ID=49265 /ORGANISM="Thalassiosira rotula, Strain GSO102" /LENGTH=51 /DNA_ID=CAMNT_0041526111 /DNA_START=42 /DNA_END=197 /DNA_ORIENTATION=+
MGDVMADPSALIVDTVDDAALPPWLIAEDGAALDELVAPVTAPPLSTGGRG